MPNPNDYIELNRQFVELNAKDVETSEIEARIGWGLTSANGWSDLLSEHRVVILSSAGTGKTWEISHQCRKLRLDGKPAFFLRLEDLAVEWEVAFEVGDAESLKQAVKVGDQSQSRCPTATKTWPIRPTWWCLSASSGGLTRRGRSGRGAGG